MGLILPQMATVRLSANNHLYYKEKGYLIPMRLGWKNKQCLDIGKELSIHVLDMQRGSKANVKVQCDYCGETYETVASTVFDILEHPYNNKCACKKCANIKKSELQQYVVDRNMDLIPLYRDKEWLYNEYITKGRTADDIANECHINVRNLRDYINKFEIDIKLIDIHEKFTYELLYELYITDKQTTKNIASKYHCDESNLIRLLDEYHIKRRTSKESMAIYYDERGGREHKVDKSLEVWKRDGFKDKMRKINKFHSNKLSHRIKQSASLQRVSIKEWKGFITPDNTMQRNRTEYKEWRNSVFERDNYTCQCCGRRNGNGETIYLNAHHKEGFADNPEMRFDIDNGITLCKECHDPRIEGSFHNLYGTYHNNTEQLNEYIKSKQTEVA